MPKKKSSEEKINLEHAPLLSVVEVTATLLWLQYEIEKTTIQLNIWKEAAKKSSDPGTTGSVAHHRTAVSVLRASAARLQQVYTAREAVGKTPPAAQVPATVLDRQPRTG